MKVQVVENGHPGDAQSFVKQFKAQVKSLKHSIGTPAQQRDVELAEYPATWADPGTNDPDDVPKDALLIVFASTQHPLDLTSHAGTLVERHLLNGGVVIPVLPTGKGASTALPGGSVEKMNAFCQDTFGTPGSGTPAWVIGLVDDVLARCWQARPERRVFISYLRRESAGVAQQLHARLIRLGVEVFLDTVAIRVAADFQKELHRRLTDMDLVVLLLTDGLLSSKWVIEELTTAQTQSIGVHVIRFPKQPSSGASPVIPPPVARAVSGLDQTKLRAAPDLTKGRPRSRKLRAAALERVVAGLLRTRSRAVLQRLTNLLPYAHAHLQKPTTSGGAPRHVVRGAKLGDLRAEQATNRKLLEYVRVTPFRPTVATLRELHGDARVVAQGADGVGCFYNEVDVTHMDAADLRWVAQAPRVHAPEQLRLWAYVGGSVQRL